MNKKILSIATVATMAMLLASCDQPATSSPARAVEQAAAQTNQSGLRNKYPIPKLSDSLELKNLAKRATRINETNLTGCIYLISYGTIMANYAVDGKVSSLNSYMLSSEQVIRDPNTQTSGAAGSLVVEQADVDGAYGSNADGIFFFTDTDSYVEWKGDYLWSDQCLTPSVEPRLTMNVTKLLTPDAAPTTPASVPPAAPTAK